MPHRLENYLILLMVLIIELYTEKYTVLKVVSFI